MTDENQGGMVPHETPDQTAARYLMEVAACVDTTENQNGFMLQLLKLAYSATVALIEISAGLAYEDDVDGAQQSLPLDGGQDG